MGQSFNCGENREYSELKVSFIMKFLIICLLIVTAVNGISVQGFADTNAVRITYARNPSAKCTKMGPECADDCKTLMFCSSFSPDPLSTVTCAAPTQYCVNGACSSNSGSCQSGGGSGGSTFKCTDEGIFPDPDDCKQFHICEANGKAEDFECDTGFVFNSKLKMCQIGRTPCTKVSCSKASEANTFIPYASNPVYYAFCMKDNSGFETIMFKCFYDEFEEFDAKTKQCQFKCRARGNFQNPAKCEEYYYCSGVNAQPVLAKCPGDWVFDGTGCNKDPDKCQHKPKENNIGGDGLSDPKPVADDVAVSALFVQLKDKIIEKICVDSVDPAVCKADTEITANDFRERTDDDTGVIDYFVSVTATSKKDSTSEIYHVKLIVDPQASTEDVDSVEGSKTADDEIKPF